MAGRDLLISFDIEADGPVPGPYSMSSVGAAAAALDDGRHLERLDLDAGTFYAELRPISDRFVPEAMAVSGLDRDRLVAEGEDPAEVMTRCARWVSQLGRQHDATPVFTAYPLGFDWLFTYWYFVCFSRTGSPFGHSRHLDIKTAFSQLAGVPVTQSVKSRVPKCLLSARRHSHNALEDAQEQGDLICNIIEWARDLPPVGAERDRLGQLVRETWVGWAQQQPSPKPSWLVPWEQLGESDREADRLIGEQLFMAGRRGRVTQPAP